MEEPILGRVCIRVWSAPLVFALLLAPALTFAEPPEFPEVAPDTNTCVASTGFANPEGVSSDHPWRLHTSSWQHAREEDFQIGGFGNRRVRLNDRRTDTLLDHVHRVVVATALRLPTPR